MPERDPSPSGSLRRPSTKPAAFTAGQRRRLARRSGLPRSQTTSVLGSSDSATASLVNSATSSLGLGSRSAMSTPNSGANVMVTPVKSRASVTAESESPTQSVHTTESRKTKKHRMRELLKSKDHKEVSEEISVPVSPIPADLQKKAAQRLGIHFEEVPDVSAPETQVQTKFKEEGLEELDAPAKLGGLGRKARHVLDFMSGYNRSKSIDPHGQQPSIPSLESRIDLSDAGYSSDSEIVGNTKTKLPFHSLGYQQKRRKGKSRALDPMVAITESGPSDNDNVGGERDEEETDDDDSLEPEEALHLPALRRSMTESDFRRFALEGHELAPSDDEDESVHGQAARMVQVKSSEDEVKSSRGQTARMVPVKSALQSQEASFLDTQLAMLRQTTEAREQRDAVVAKMKAEHEQFKVEFEALKREHQAQDAAWEQFKKENDIHPERADTSHIYYRGPEDDVRKEEEAEKPVAEPSATYPVAAHPLCICCQKRHEPGQGHVTNQEPITDYPSDEEPVIMQTRAMPIRVVRPGEVKIVNIPPMKPRQNAPVQPTVSAQVANFDNGRAQNSTPSRIHNTTLTRPQKMYPTQTENMAPERVQKSPTVHRSKTSSPSGSMSSTRGNMLPRVGGFTSLTDDLPLPRIGTPKSSSSPGERPKTVRSTSESSNKQIVSARAGMLPGVGGFPLLTPTPISGDNSAVSSPKHRETARKVSPASSSGGNETSPAQANMLPGVGGFTLLPPVPPVPTSDRSDTAENSKSAEQARKVSTNSGSSSIDLETPERDRVQSKKSRRLPRDESRNLVKGWLDSSSTAKQRPPSERVDPEVLADQELDRAPAPPPKGDQDRSTQKHQCVLNGHLFRAIDLERVPNNASVNELIINSYFQAASGIKQRVPVHVQCDNCNKECRSEVYECEIPVCRLTVCYECSVNMQVESESRAIQSWGH